MKTLKLIALLAITIAVASCSKDKEDYIPNPGQVIDITTPEFKILVANPSKGLEDWVYLGDKPAIVAFHATWCPYCQQIAPTLAQLSIEYADQIYVYKVDTDLEKGLANAYNVTKLPTMLFIPMEGAPKVVTGAISKKVFVNTINSVMLNLNKK